MVGDTDFPASTTFGPYTIVREIGVGRMGTVYEAHHQELNQSVALRVPPSDLEQDAEYLERFKETAKRAMGLEHPTLVKVIETGNANGRHFLVTELVLGERLQDRLDRENRMLFKDALRLMEQVALGLVYALENNIVHGDIKPANLMLTKRGALKITDVGLAKPYHEQQPEGKQAKPASSHLYCAPEKLLKPQLEDCRCDVYSVGATFYQLVTGQLPFSGDTIEELHKQKRLTPPTPVNDLNRAVAPSLAAIIHQTLSPNPDERYATPMELLEQMQGQDAFLVTQMGAGGHVATSSGGVDSAGEDSSPGVSDTDLSASATKWALIVVALLLLLFVLFVMIRESRRPRPQTPPAPGVQSTESGFKSGYLVSDAARGRPRRVRPYRHEIAASFEKSFQDEASHDHRSAV